MLSDLRFAFRQLAKTPGFTLIAVLTLAVGIGSATVVFSTINSLLLKPLPHVTKADEERLLYVTEASRMRGKDDIGWNYADFLDVQARATTLAGIWVHSDRTIIIASKNEPERLLGTEITWDAFTHMGVQPVLGRNFTAQDAELKAPEVALISTALWKRRFGGEPEIVGSTVTLNGQPVTIIGVMPENWRYPDFTDVWTVLRLDAARVAQRGDYWLSGRARMKPGVTVAQVQAELDTIMGALAQQFPTTNSNIGARAMPIREEAAQDVRHLSLLLFGAVSFVFLIACVNVANLLLARGATRSKEIAIRLALGADRGRIIRQLLTESAALALVGGAAGLLLGLWANDALVAAIPVEIPFWLRFDFDVRVFAFVLGVSLLAALIVGVIPAFKASRPDLIAELKEGGRVSDENGPQGSRLRNILVVAEVALALILLVGAGLMMRSFLTLRRVDPGFCATNVLTFRVGFPPVMVDDKSSIPAQFFRDLLPRLEAIPGVSSAALTTVLPGLDSNISAAMIEGRPQPKSIADALLPYARAVTPGYFSTVCIPLKAGRVFDDGLDRLDTPKVAVIDEYFATHEFGSVERALGQRVRFLSTKPDEKPEWLQIVGVVGNIRHRLDRDEAAPTIYLSVQQHPTNFMSVVLRTRADPAGFIPAAREAVLSVNRGLPIYTALSLDDVLLRTVWQRRSFSHLFTIFGIVALFLACIGIYGVMSYNVAQRTREIGVRMALGAQPGAVVRMVVHRGLSLVTCGLAAGMIVALALANLLASSLYGVSPHDPPTFAAVPLLLGAVALVACWLPSRRATRIAPVEALRAG